MTTVDHILGDIESLGVKIKTDGSELMVKDPGGNVTASLAGRLKKHKTELIARLTVKQVAKPGKNLNSHLSNGEFTDRYLLLSRAFRAGNITEKLRDYGIFFLLQNWEGDFGLNPSPTALNKNNNLQMGDAR